ncbi:MAG: IS1634 family transposase [Verrucomicrobia bacterium]|nr:IS1634 family transposase [Verrucomicrobiota bacterium]
MPMCLSMYLKSFSWIQRLKMSQTISSAGAVAVLQGLAGELGITAALGEDRQGKLALWQVIARAIDQGSRLSAVRLASSHACCDLLGLDAFNEDHLYANLAWLSEHQADIELRLFEQTHPAGKPPLFLYDVTSSYLEGQHNAFGCFGYNRDGKRGKKQIVIGLLCDGEGVPLAIEVFAGNTLDPKTMTSQIQKVATRFGGGAVTFVGDRGMLQDTQIAELVKQGFHYITAITKPQIESLLKTGVFQMELFDQSLAEVCEPDTRYVLRRNPIRAEETQATRQSKLDSLARRAEQANQYLTEHPRARVATAIKSLQQQLAKLKLASWVSIGQTEGRRAVELRVDEEERGEESKLDGCYALKTDLTTAQADKETVHSRYKDLALVEQAFRISKTVELEMRPIHVRCEASTRGHALVVMLAYILVRELARRWIDLDLTVEEGINQLATLCVTEIISDGKARCGTLPKPRPDVAELIARSGIQMPAVIRSRGVKVATKKKLPPRRVKRS